MLDTVAQATVSLYYQTIHEKPIAFGYVSRLQKSVLEKDMELVETTRNQQFQKLRDDYGIVYLVARNNTDVVEMRGERTGWPRLRVLHLQTTDLHQIYSDDTVRIFSIR